MKIRVQFLVLLLLALANCTQESSGVAPQKWYDITPDITATLKYGVDSQRYALGAVSDYVSPAGSDAKTLVYIARQDGGETPIPQDTAGNVAAQFANVTLCKSGRASLVQAEPPVYRKDINSWAIALSCAA